jgi:hypothetical protein
VNLSLGDEEDPNKSSLRKTVAGLQIFPRKQTFAEEDLKQSISVNGPGAACGKKQIVLQSANMIAEEGDQHVT